MSDINTTIEPHAPLTTWRDSPFWQSLEALRPWLQWGLVALSMVLGVYLYQRDTNAQQILNLTDLQRKQDAFEKALATEKSDRLQDRKDMVTRELFNERTEAFQKQLTNIDNRTIEILDRLPVRNP